MTKSFTACLLAATALAASAAFVSPAAFAQPVAVQPGDVLVYERSDKPGPGPTRGVYRWPAGDRQVYRLVRKPAGQMALAAQEAGKVTGEGKVMLFDPVTFSIAQLPSVDAPNAGYPINIETDRRTGEFPTGARWGMIITQPFTSADGKCAGTMRQEIVAVSNGVVTATLDNGDTVDKAAINVTQEGRFNNCADHGAFTRSLHYSRPLGAPTMIESVQLSPKGSIVGGYRLVLREVRRAP